MLRLVVLSSFIGLASLWAAGEQVLDLDFVDLEGRVHHLSEFHKAPALIVAAFRHNCPVSLKSLPSLVRLSKENPTVPLIIVNTSDEASSETLRGALRRAGFSGIVAPDTNHSLGKALAIRSSTETFVLDGARTIRYRGPIHDQYGLGTARATVTKEYLKEALQDVLAGRRVRTQEVEAPGCHLNYSDAKPPSQHRIEYYPRLARIIQDRCEACHRQGEAGPMAFTRYEEVKDNREMIKFVVESGIMPPWFPHAGSGPFENDHSLTQSEKADLLAWIEAGTPEGDKALAPVPIRWPTGWTLGTPDSILKIPRAKVPAEGKIPYRYVELPTQFSEDKWITSVEFRMIHPKNVHHILVFLKDSEQLKTQGLSGVFAGMVPGSAAWQYPEEAAVFLPRGAHLVFQIHYQVSGTEVEEESLLGFRFAKGPTPYRMECLAPYNTSFAIPPGDPAHRVEGTYTFQKHFRILSFHPHMHLRGKAFTYELLYRNGARKTILDLPRYNFNWQLTYQLRQPIDVPAGTQMRAIAIYDNSANNPANPDPTQTVRFGQQSEEEMMIGYFDGYALNLPMGN